MLRIFPNVISQNLTAEFDISETATLIQTKGMGENQEFLVEFFFGEECDGSWEPFMLCCGQMKIAYPQNTKILPAIPGKYRLVAIDTQQPLAFDPVDWEEVEVQITKMKIPVSLENYSEVCC